MITLKRVETIEIQFTSEEDKVNNWERLRNAGWVYIEKLNELCFKFKRNIL